MSEYLYGVLAPAHLAGRPADGNQAVYSALGFGKPEAAFIDVFQRRIAMPKSSMSGIPGADAMADTLEMVKAMWSGMGVPGMMMPSASADDINKQIAVLKAGESWLARNMSMLRNTIQALEVQSATISNLHSMRDAMSAMAAKIRGIRRKSVCGGLFFNGRRFAQSRERQNARRQTGERKIRGRGGRAGTGGFFIRAADG